MKSYDGFKAEMELIKRFAVEAKNNVCTNALIEVKYLRKEITFITKNLRKCEVINVG
ncbi:hypothetical protein Q4561_19515 [Alteromonas sp. 1_MG-2023]|uniref:hypothetical protein n=1 Tax=Alteromonas sp. 1_MG-2023 TaxID=3062669 RepID=UPI0026E14B1F|nr:hypothetical protein [Alteromonas sp. 1_MG-2023]MDO6569263.1 hypothetical protein [Alteromonas sp. 1_MG-2023]